MKKTLTLTLCESEGVKIEVSCEVLRIETDNPAIHPDDPNQGTIIAYLCEWIWRIELNGIEINALHGIENMVFNKEISRLVESQLESNPELFES